MLSEVARLQERNTSALKYWAAGLVFVIVAWIAFIPIVFFQGFFQFLMLEYGNIIISLAYVLFYVTVVPYILGRIIKWVSDKVF